MIAAPVPCPAILLFPGFSPSLFFLCSFTVLVLRVAFGIDFAHTAHVFFGLGGISNREVETVGHLFVRLAYHPPSPAFFVFLLYTFLYCDTPVFFVHQPRLCFSFLFSFALPYLFLYISFILPLTI